MDNLTVAEALYEIADLLEFTGGDPFKVRAYRRAAEALGLLPEQVADLVREGRLTRAPASARPSPRRSRRWWRRAESATWRSLRQAVPPGVLDLTRVPGLGARTAMLLYRRLGIDSLEALELAAREGRLRDLPGFGPRKESALLVAVAQARRRPDRLSIGAAVPIAEAVAARLRAHPAVQQVAVAGSIRRRAETVGTSTSSSPRGTPLRSAPSWTACPRCPCPWIRWWWRRRISPRRCSSGRDRRPTWPRSPGWQQRP